MQAFMRKMQKGLAAMSRLVAIGSVLLVFAAIYFSGLVLIPGSTRNIVAWSVFIVLLVFALWNGFRMFRHDRSKNGPRPRMP
jgi:hypothetical protein